MTGTRLSSGLEYIHTGTNGGTTAADMFSERAARNTNLQPIEQIGQQYTQHQVQTGPKIRYNEQIELSRFCNSLSSHGRAKQTLSQNELSGKPWAFEDPCTTSKKDVCFVDTGSNADTVPGRAASQTKNKAQWTGREMFGDCHRPFEPGETIFRPEISAAVRLILRVSDIGVWWR